MVHVPNTLQTGIYYEVQKTVDAADVAANYGSHELQNLLATPAYVAMMIEAATQAVDPLLPDGLVTVGQSMEFIHQAPTVLGMNITVRATLNKLEDNKLSFIITAHDEIGEIGHGKHVRLIVNRDSLLKRAYERAGVYGVK
eukprot:TRINITY_DN30346_c0_g1_i1.p1 TRINITY_DN30346_c0_g1~~TRINITY_DN30346_c0_g1_i1.p1  ORF type:complete len:141 (+),score=10.19 TRINITY_DN30346_c0_g1_i1:3-425(+)